MSSSQPLTDESYHSSANLSSQRENGAEKGGGGKMAKNDGIFIDRGEEGAKIMENGLP